VRAVADGDRVIGADDKGAGPLPTVIVSFAPPMTVTGPLPAVIVSFGPPISTLGPLPA
jgi:hypothetical protein